MKTTLSTILFICLHYICIACNVFEEEWVFIISTLDGQVLSTKEGDSSVEVYLDKLSYNRLDQLWKLDHSGRLINALSLECLSVDPGYLRPRRAHRLSLKKATENSHPKWSLDKKGYLRSSMNGFVLERLDNGDLDIALERHYHIHDENSSRQKWLLRADGKLIDKNLLERVSLEKYPMAKTTDHSTAVYYRQTERAEANKFIIYLQGGGFCIPWFTGMDCTSRCTNTPWLCSAWTREYFDAAGSNYGDNIFSDDPGLNPAFHNFHKVFLPYSSSDVHAGTRSPGVMTNNFTFHGKYIFKAMVDDLVENTWITQAEQVVLMGGSAGAIGTEFNCDYLSDLLHDFNPDIDVRCISDSGSLYPSSVHTENCYPDQLMLTAFNMWSAESDESCEDANPSKLPCINFGTSYKYTDTPILAIKSFEDKGISFCTSNNEEFWDEWRHEIDLLTRNIIQDRADIGMFIPNCPVHVAAVKPTIWNSMEVPLLDGEEGEMIVLKNLVYNFVNNKKPFQAVDDVNIRNPACDNLSM